MQRLDKSSAGVERHSHPFNLIQNCQERVFEKPKNQDPDPLDAGQQKRILALEDGMLDRK